jgi:REP element-mobilizing transposase RayT
VGRQLSLRAVGRRGGYRAGAGRKVGRSDTYVPNLPRPAVTRHNGVHVTLRLVDGLPSLRRPRSLHLIEAVFVAERRRKGFRLVHYAVRGNHVHLVCEAEERLALSRGVQRLSSRIARGLNRLLRRDGRVFADRFHSRMVRSPREARHLLAYVLLNAHKDYARSGQRLIGLDPCSSGRWFDGWADVPARAPPGLDANEREPEVAPPRSWLLRVGWRRHGLLRTDERAPRSAVPVSR